MRHYWVDRIEIVEPGVKGVGRKAVAFSEDFFSDHFPGNPVFPGIYLIEGMAQTAGAIIAKGSEWEEFALMVSVDRARFSSFARPGDLLEYTVEVERSDGGLATAMASASAAGRRIAQARISFRVLSMGDIIPPIYGEQWAHTLSQLFEPRGSQPEGSSDR